MSGCHLKMTVGIVNGLSHSQVYFLKKMPRCCAGSVVIKNCNGLLFIVAIDKIDTKVVSKLVKCCAWSFYFVTYPAFHLNEDLQSAPAMSTISLLANMYWYFPICFPKKHLVYTDIFCRMAQLLSKFRIQCQDMKIIPDIGKLPSEKR